MAEPADQLGTPAIEDRYWTVGDSEGVQGVLERLFGRDGWWIFEHGPDDRTVMARGG